MASILRKSGWWWLLTVMVFLIFWAGYLTPPNPFRTRTEEGKDGRAVFLEDPNGIPVRAEADLDQNGTTDAVSFYFRGKEVLLISLDKDGRPKGSWVSFYDEAGKLTKAWVDHGQGEFTDRISYAEEKPKMEIWVGGSWQAVEVHDSKKGILVNGQWQAVGFTNGSWYIRQ